MNMWRRSLSSIVFIVCFTNAFSFELLGFSRPNPLKIDVVKTGPYFGIQKGKYAIFELGVERQWKQIKLNSPSTHAVHAGFNYNFKYNVLGYDLGYWFKQNRLGFTYGATLCLRTNFDRTRVGIAPVVGYKLWQFHLQTGYHFLTRSTVFKETNGLFISLRFVLINDRDVDVDRKKKDKLIFSN